MPDFRVADTASEHPKLRAAGLPAAGLWSMAGAYCMNPSHLTDGWVPAYWVTGWPSGKKLAAKLVEVGLWREEKRDGIAGWRFHDWTDIQRSAEQIALEKSTNAVRRDLYASPKLVAAIKERDGERCRYCGRVVSWTNRRGSAGATFDHVLPIPQGGRNDLDNVVVACRGCNAGKGSRTPEQAGMPLLTPQSTSDQTQNGTSSGTRTEPGKNNPPIPVPIPIPSVGDLGGEGHLGNAEASDRPLERCAKHRNDNRPPPCGACGDARQARQRWDRDNAARVRACTWCDGDGWRWDPAGRHRGPSNERCNHQPRRAAS